MLLANHKTRQQHPWPCGSSGFRSDVRGSRERAVSPSKTGIVKVARYVLLPFTAALPLSALKSGDTQDTS